MHFVKVHGAGNDFVLLPDLDDRVELDPALVRALCSAHTGLGADGVIRLAPARPGVDADVFMDYWNADGGVAEMCGNGVRCVAKYVADRHLVEGPAVLVDTRAGVKPVEIVERDAIGLVRLARVDMGAPVPGKIDEPLEVPTDMGATTVRLTTLSMGNPHAVIFVDDVAQAPVTTLGPLLERHDAFPEGTNVEFIRVLAPDRIEGRIWERGVGETMASGTGASAMAVGAALLDLADRSVLVSLPGGTLEVAWLEEGVQVTGPAAEVASGELDAAWLAAVEQVGSSSPKGGSRTG